MPAGDVRFRVAASAVVAWATEDGRETVASRLLMVLHPNPTNRLSH